MRIPITYNLRNLAVRKGTTAMTALGITLTVAVLLSVLALVEGLRTSFAATGHPLNILVMRKGATAELMSTISPRAYQDLKFKPGIARGPRGESMASLEMVTVINLENPGVADGVNLNLRGLAPIGWELRENVRIIAGRRMEPGRREVVVGRSIAARYAGARLGSKLQFGRGEWEVVGIMDGDRSAVNSEIFADLNQVSSDYNRTEVLSSVLVRAADAVSVQALIRNLEDDRTANLMAQREQDYYAAQTGAALPIQLMGTFVAVIMAVGSSFAAMNTMYAAVARRAAEIGVLRVLGFSRGGILLSFLLESILLSLLGGALGCLLVLPLNNISTGIGSFVTFAEVAFQFHVGPKTMLWGIGFAILMGAAGGFFPARMAANKEILTAFGEA